MDTVVLDGDIGLNIVIDGAASLSVEGSGNCGINNRADGEAALDIIIDGAVSLDIGGRAECGIITQISGEYPFYNGAVTVTPSAEAVTLATKDKVVRSDIVVNPIPSNYGLITWNGSTLTVS